MSQGCRRGWLVGVILAQEVSRRLYSSEGLTGVEALLPWWLPPLPHKGIWLLAGGPATHFVDLSKGLLECPPNLAAAFSQEE